QNGHKIDSAALSEELGIPVVPLVASAGKGVPELRQIILDQAHGVARAVEARAFRELSAPLEKEVSALAGALEDPKRRRASPRAEALLILSDEKLLKNSDGSYSTATREAVAAARQRLEEAGVDWRSAPIEARYARVAAIQQAVTVAEGDAPSETFSDRLDRVVTHKFWGLLIFVGIMAAMFLTIFTLARLPMDLLQGIFDFAGNTIARAMPPGELQSLLVKGVIEGVGAVVVFLPQICLLFLFIGLLEDTGYMARAAFLMD